MLQKNCVAMFYRIFSASDWAPYENGDEATMTALAQALDQEGWGVKNTNFAQEGSFKGTQFQYDLAPNTSLASPGRFSKIDFILYIYFF